MKGIPVKTTDMATKQLTTAEFKQTIYDYDKSGDWNYSGKLPAIIDFYADWCGPCKMIAPILEELSTKYEGKIDIYKVDTEQEPELSALFNIQSIPTLLFIPLNGNPMVQKGAIPKHVFIQVIEGELLEKQETGF